MVLISSHFENMWVPFGVGVAGFLSGMALASSAAAVLMVHPFIVIFKPAVARKQRNERSRNGRCLADIARFPLLLKALILLGFSMFLWQHP
jgi:hypothetical protein